MAESIAELAKGKGKKSTVDAIERNVAIEVKRFWPVIHGLAKKRGVELPLDPTEGITGATPEATEAAKEEKWLEIARGMIDKRAIIFGDQSLSLDDAEEELQNQKIGISLKKRIPTRKQVNMLAETVGISVQRNTGTGISFLDDLLGGASLGNTFMGFISWLFSGGKGGFDGLKATIASLTGKDMAADTGRSLTKLRDKHRGTDDDLSGFLTNSVIQEFSKGVERAPLDQLNLPGHKPAASERIRDVKMGDIGPKARELASGQIKTTLEISLDAGFKKQFHTLYTEAELKDREGVWDTVSKYYEGGRALVGIPAERTRHRAILEKTKTELSEKINTFLLDPKSTFKGKKLSELSKDDLSAALAEKTKEIILASRDEAVKKGLSDKSTDYALYAVLADRIPTELQEPLGKHYDSLKLVLGGDFTKKIENIAGVHVLLDDPKLQKEAAQYFTTKIKDELSAQLSESADTGRKLIMVTGKPLKETHFTAIAELVAEPMYKAATTDKKKYGEAVAAFIKTPIDAAAQEKATKAYIDVSDTIFKELKEGKIKIDGKTITELTAQDGIKLNDDILRIFADNMAAGYFADIHNVKKPPQAFIDRMKATETKLAGPALDAKLDEVLAKTETLDQLRSGSKDSVNWTDEVQENVIRELKATLKPELLSYISDEEKAKEMKKDTVYETVSDSIFAKLKANPTLSATYTDATLLVLADTMAEEYVTQQRALPDQQKTAISSAAGVGFTVPVPLPSAFVKRKNKNMDNAGIELLTGMVDRPEYAEIIEQADALNKAKGATRSLVTEKAAIIKTAASCIREITQEDKFKAMTDPSAQYAYVCEQLREKLQFDQAHVFANPNVTLMLSDLLAAKFVGKKNPQRDKEGNLILDAAGKPVPSEVPMEAREKAGIKTAEAEMAKDAVDMLLKKALLEKKDLLVQANLDVDVNIDQIAASMKPVLDEALKDRDKLSKLTAVEYNQLVDKIATTLQDPKTGISANNGELRDVIALLVVEDVSKGVTPKGKTPPFSSTARELGENAFKRLSRKIANNKIEKSLRPLLTGAPSPEDPYGANNNVIANCLTIEASSEGKVINVDVICTKVSDIMTDAIYLKATRTGFASYEHTYLESFRTALADPACGLGKEAQEMMAQSLAKELAANMGSSDFQQAQEYARGSKTKLTPKEPPKILTLQEQQEERRKMAESARDKTIKTITDVAGPNLEAKTYTKLKEKYNKGSLVVSLDDISPWSKDVAKAGSDGIRNALTALINTNEIPFSNMLASDGKRHSLSWNGWTQDQRAKIFARAITASSNIELTAMDRTDWGGYKAETALEIGMALQEKLAPALKPVTLPAPASPLPDWATARKQILEKEGAKAVTTTAIKRAEEYFTTIDPQYMAAKGLAATADLYSRNETTRDGKPNPQWYLTESPSTRLAEKSNELSRQLTGHDQYMNQILQQMKSTMLEGVPAVTQATVESHEDVARSVEALKKATAQLEEATKKFEEGKANPALTEELKWQLDRATHTKLRCETAYKKSFCSYAEKELAVARERIAIAEEFNTPEKKAAFARELRRRLKQIDGLEDPSAIREEMSTTNPKNIAQLLSLEVTKKALTKRVEVEPAPAEKGFKIPVIFERDPKDASKPNDDLKKALDNGWPIESIRKLRNALLKIPLEHRQKAFDANFGKELLARGEAVELTFEVSQLRKALTHKETIVYANPRIAEGPVFLYNIREKAELAGIDLVKEFPKLAAVPEVAEQMKGYVPPAVATVPVAAPPAEPVIKLENTTAKTQEFMKWTEILFKEIEGRMQKVDGEWKVKRSDDAPFVAPTVNKYNAFGWIDEDGKPERNKTGKLSIVEAADLLREKLKNLNKDSKEYAAYKATYTELGKMLDENSKEWNIDPKEDTIPALDAGNAAAAPKDDKAQPMPSSITLMLNGTMVEIPLVKNPGITPAAPKAPAAPTLTDIPLPAPAGKNTGSNGKF